jgi:hypothetical protein
MKVTGTLICACLGVLPDSCAAQLKQFFASDWEGFEKGQNNNGRRKKNSTQRNGPDATRALGDDGVESERN